MNCWQLYVVIDLCFCIEQVFVAGAYGGLGKNVSRAAHRVMMSFHSLSSSLLNKVDLELCMQVCADICW